MTQPADGAEEPSRRPLLVLAVAIYLPLLLTAPGRIGADTKSYLYLDPGRLLSRAWSMWDPNVGLGTVSHQTIGYLWPMGPWFWVFERLGVPDWVAQRLWLGTILFAAGAGVRWLLLRVFGWRPGASTVAAFGYALTPYVLTLAARLSAILLPYAGLPWLIGLTVLSVRRGGWRYPAAFALVVATVGSVNATALLLVGLAPAWWLVHAVATRTTTLRAAVGATARIAVLTVAASLWWLAGLWAQGRYGIEILRYTETAEVVASASNGAEVLRGLGYWFFYGGDRLGPWIEPSVSYTQVIVLLAATFLVPLLAVASATLVRFRDRSYFVGLVAIGTLVAVGAHPWDDPALLGDGFKAFLRSDVGLAMRSLPRAVPLVALGVTACLGAGAQAVGDRWAAATRPRPPDRRRATAVVVASCALVYLCLPPLWTGQLVAENLDRPSDLPAYWDEVADHLSAGDPSSRVLEVPGADFASYRWGNTVDPVTPGITDRAYAARELIPYGTPAAADLLSALDRRLQERTLEPGALAVVARLLGVDEVVLRDDLQFERYRSPRPYQLAPFLDAEVGLGDPLPFGEPVVNQPVPEVPMLDELALALDDQLPRPPVAIYPVEDPGAIIRAKPAAGVVVLAGDGEGLVDVAAAGLLAGHELIRYAASLDAEEMAEALEDGGILVVTDGNRRQGRRWSTVRDVLGYVEPVPVLLEDLSDNRLPVFPEAGAGWQTVSVPATLTVTATSYGNQNTFTPEYRPGYAADGDVGTEWRTGASADVQGERVELEVEPDAGIEADELRIVQQLTGFRNRHITEVAITVDDGEPVRVELGPASLESGGQVVALPVTPGDRVHRVTIEVLDDSSGRDASWGRPVRFNGLSQVGFAELELLGADAASDAALALAPAATAAIPGDDTPVALVLTRWRTEPTESVRIDPEAAIARAWHQPVNRTASLQGTARLTPRAGDDLLATVVGTSGPVVVGSSRLVGVASAIAVAALDGDPSTWWSPAIGDPEPALSVTAPGPVTIDSIAPLVVDDGRRSVPTSIRVEADGEVVASVPVAGDGSVAPLPAPVTATTFRFVVDGAAPRSTTEWFTNAAITVPVAIAELGVPGLATEVPPRFDTGCRTDLLTLDGAAVPIRLAGDVADALTGGSFEVEPCGGSVELGAGDHRLEAAPGLTTGLDLDQLVLLSGDLPVAASTAGPEVTVRSDERFRSRVAITGATPEEPFWLVLGQSQSAGWELDGQTSELVDGYANGWLITPESSDFAVTLEWRPQRVVNLALAASGAAVLGCLVVVLLPPLGRRRGRGGPDAATRPPPGPARAPSGRWEVLVVAAVAVGSAVAIGLLAGVVVGVVSAAMAVGPRWLRRAARLAPVLAYALAAGYIVARQVVSQPTAAFEWPAEQATAHQPALVAVALLVAVVALDARRPAAGT